MADDDPRPWRSRWTPRMSPSARTWAAAVADHADLIKLGLEFYLRNGGRGVAEVREAAPDCGLFLDLKLHDIPATVAGGARAVASLRTATT